MSRVRVLAALALVLLGVALVAAGVVADWPVVAAAGGAVGATGVVGVDVRGGGS